MRTLSPLLLSLPPWLWLSLLCALPAAAASAAPLQDPAVGWTDVPDFKHFLGASTAFDWNRNKLVRFGGGMRTSWAMPNKQRMHRNETWEWSGGQWVHRKPLHRPSARSMHGMAYDPISKRMILFGGSDLTSIFGDTWAYDGQDWTKLSPTNSPPPLLGASMALDKGRGRIVLFGGGVGWKWGGVTPQSDTWEWDGKDWHRMKLRVSPPPTVLGQMVYSPTSKAMVLVGSKTWEWNGKVWKSFPGGPSSFWVSSLVTDWRTGMALSFAARGSSGKNYSGYHWNGKSWQLAGLSFALPFHAPEMVADPQSKQLLVIGRGDLNRSKNLRGWDVSTWTFDGKTWKLADHWKTYNWPSHMVHDAARDEFLLMTDAWPDMPNMVGWRIKGARIEPFYSQSKPPFTGSGQTMIYHPGLKKIWTFGSRLTQQTWSTDIWTWNGKGWAKIASKNPPPIKWGNPLPRLAIYYPPHDSVLVTMLGNSDVWEWSLAAGWKKLAQGIPLKGSTYSIGYALAYDPARKKIVLWGGKGGYSTNVAETWEWNGAKWSEIRTKTKPPIRLGAYMFYVSSMGGMVMFGGRGVSLTQRDAWFYDGTNWSKITDKAFSIGGWPISGAAYDPGRQRIRIFQTSLSRESRMSEFRFPNLRTSQRYPRPGQTIQLLTTLPRRAGKLVLYVLAWSARPGIPLRPVPGLGTELLPLAPDALLAASLQMGLVTVLDAKGQASLSMRIPAQASMIGLRFHAAAVAFTKTLGVGAITNDVAIEVVK